MIIFDCDGVLLDSEVIADRILCESLSELINKNQESQNENWVGELFFMLNLLAVHLGVDTEKALRNTNRKFENEVEEFEKGLNFLDAESISQKKGQFKDLLMKFLNIRD